MNEPVMQMIKTLHARLNDLQIVVEKYPKELTGYDKKLDKIDDQVYLIIADLEKQIKKLEEEAKLPQFNVVHGSPNQQGTESAQEVAAESQTSEKEEVSVEAQTVTENASADEEVQSASGSAESAAEATDKPSEPVEAKRTIAAGYLTEDYELTPKAKESLSSAAQSFGSFLKDAKEVTGEFSDVKKDLQETLDFLPKGKRKRW